MTSFEVMMVRMVGLLRSFWWNGGEVKCAVTSVRSDMSEISASGWVSETVYLSRLAHSLRPNSLIAAIWRMIAGIETFTAVTAILSLAFRSRIDFRCSARVLRYIGIEVIAATPLMLALPRVRSHVMRK